MELSDLIELTFLGGPPSLRLPAFICTGSNSDGFMTLSWNFYISQRRGFERKIVPVVMCCIKRSSFELLRLLLWLLRTLRLRWRELCDKKLSRSLERERRPSDCFLSVVRYDPEVREKSLRLPASCD